jgi:hypothetical protein
MTGTSVWRTRSASKSRSYGHRRQVNVFSAHRMSRQPKCGTMPPLAWLGPPLAAIKGRICRFCMHRLYKCRSKAGAAFPPPGDSYCPVALFRGSVQDAEEAIAALFMYPANNLRIFRNGQRSSLEVRTCCSRLEWSSHLSPSLECQRDNATRFRHCRCSPSCRHPR